jgi:carbon storage regulator
MLVLSRKTNESLVIRDDIVITVVEIRGDRVRLGIQAPREVTVHRKEIYENIQESGRRKDSSRHDAASEK